MDIKEARKKIDSIDTVLVKEFEKRLNLIKEIGKYKDEHHLPLIDEERDEDIIALHKDLCKDENLSPYVKNYLKTVVSMSNEFLKEHMHKHIFLIGMPGAGKTTVGKMLAKELGRDFYDLDQTIQDKVGKSVQNIFIYDGKDAFSKYEYSTIKELIRNKPSVIATGGGTVTYDKTVKLMRNNGLVVFVNRDVNHILDDLDLEIRPLVKESIEYIFNVYEERYPLYEQVAHIKIGNEGSITDAVQEIIEALPNTEK
ncbi:shikimate kinase [Veillonella denticariosi JCM 15641]|uniref:Shikimate kinase n=1 Tax=Veillonella denticariosi JCM 15641 TaxID=1298594 RepID=A0A2S7Z6X4_9FIRM|nr:shikimate kinase [Veillonella denticariosi]PQL18989.1 shikimate kinase [Veillonella denticariosi JCM 15641]